MAKIESRNKEYKWNKDKEWKKNQQHCVLLLKVSDSEQRGKTNIKEVLRAPNHQSENPQTCFPPE